MNSPSRRSASVGLPAGQTPHHRLPWRVARTASTSRFLRAPSRLGPIGNAAPIGPHLKRTLSALFALGALLVFPGQGPVFAQTTTVLLDDFDGNTPDAAWTWTTNATAKATIAQANGRLIVSALNPSHPGSDTYNGITARRNVMPVSDFELTADVEWKSFSAYSVMQILVVRLHGPANTLVASIGYRDSWVDWSGSAVSEIGQAFYSTGNNSLPLDGQQRFSLVRSGGVITASMGTTVLQTATSVEPVSAVELEFLHFSSVRGSSFGEVAISRLAVTGTPDNDSPTEPCKTRVGGIVANQTWTTQDSPYCVTNDVYVSGTLTIREGVEVRFEGNHVFEVAGRLRAVGTAESPIRFHPADRTVGWQGLLFRDAVPGSFLVHTIIEGSKNSGVRITNTPPAFTNCVFRGNSTANGGGGLSAEIATGDLVLASCLLANNQGTRGGGLNALMGSGSLVLSDCLVTNNQSTIYGGGIYLIGRGWFSDSLIARNRVEGNDATGGGVASAENQLLLRNCQVVANAASGSGAIAGGIYISGASSASRVHLHNCKLLLNQASRAGGGLFLYRNAQADAVNCVFAENQPEAIQVWNDAGRLTLTNSIVFFNGTGATDGGAIGGSPASIAVGYSDIQKKVWPGPGNLSVAPALCPDTYSLIEGSPCIDAGHPGLEFRDGCLSNDPCTPLARGGSRNDMGAYGGPGVCYWTQPRAEPVIRIEPENEIGFEGQPVTLSVLATGQESLAYRWFKDGAPVAGQTNAVWTFPAAALAQVGSYVVEVANDLGTVTSSPVRLGIAKYETRPNGWSGQRPRLLIRNGKAGGSCAIYSISRLRAGDTLAVPGFSPEAWELRETVVFPSSEVEWTDPQPLDTDEERFYSVLPAP